MILLELDKEARAKLRPKMKQIRRDIYKLLQFLRSTGDKPAAGECAMA